MSTNPTKKKVRKPKKNPKKTFKRPKFDVDITMMEQLFGPIDGVLQEQLNLNKSVRNKTGNALMDAFPVNTDFKSFESPNVLVNPNFGSRLPVKHPLHPVFDMFPERPKEIRPSRFVFRGTLGTGNVGGGPPPTVGPAGPTPPPEPPRRRRKRGESAPPATGFGADGVIGPLDPITPPPSPFGGKGTDLGKRQRRSRSGGDLPLEERLLGLRREGDGTSPPAPLDEFGLPILPVAGEGFRSIDADSLIGDALNITTSARRFGRVPTSSERRTLLADIPPFNPRTMFGGSSSSATTTDSELERLRIAQINNQPITRIQPELGLGSSFGSSVQGSGSSLFGGLSGFRGLSADEQSRISREDAERRVGRVEETISRGSGLGRGKGATIGKEERQSQLADLARADADFNRDEDVKEEEAQRILQELLASEAVPEALATILETPNKPFKSEVSREIKGAVHDRTSGLSVVDMRKLATTLGVKSVSSLGREDLKKAIARSANPFKKDKKKKRKKKK